MSDAANLRVASLLSSRLCHDLVGPLGAVDNGLELLAEGGGMAEEALALAQRSAKRATSRLQYFRYAFGAAGGESNFGTTEARAFAQGLLQNGEIALEWPGSGIETLPAGAGRMLLNMLLLAIDCLPRGGRIQVTTRPDYLAVECMGAHARMTAELRSAVEGTTALADLTARTVVGHYAQLLAASLGGKLAVQDEGSEKIRLVTPIGPIRSQ